MYRGSPIVNKIISILTWSSLLLLVPLATLGFMSENSIPGNPLYPMKRAIENIVTSFDGFDKNALALYTVSLVAQRFSETKKLASENSIALNTSQVQDFISQINSARETINAVTNPQEKQTLRNQLIQQIENYRNQLVILQTQQSGPTNIASEPLAIILPTPSQVSDILPSPTDQSNSTSQLQSLINQLQQEQTQIQQDQTNAPLADGLITPTDVLTPTNDITLSNTPTIAPNFNQNQPQDSPTILVTPTQMPAITQTFTPTNTPTIIPTKNPVPTSGITPTVQPQVPTAVPTEQQAQQQNFSSPNAAKWGQWGNQHSATIIASDTFRRQDQTLWGTATDGQNWIGDVNTLNNFSITSHQGVVSNINATIPYGVTLHGILGPQIFNGEVLITGGANAYTNASIYSGFGAVLRYTDENNFYRGYITGSYLIITKKVGGSLYFLSQIPFPASNMSVYAIRFQIIGSSLSIKAWQTKNPEPANWMSTVTDTSLPGPGFSGVRMTLDSQNQIFAYLSYQATQL